MVTMSNFSLSATIGKCYNRLFRCKCGSDKDLKTVPSAFDHQAQESTRLLLQRAVEQNQSGGPPLRKGFRPARAALPGDDEMIHPNRDDGIQADIQPATLQTRTQRPSSSVTVSSCLHTCICTHKQWPCACYVVAWQQLVAFTHVPVLACFALILCMYTYLLGPRSPLHGRSRTLREKLSSNRYWTRARKPVSRGRSIQRHSQCR